MANEQNLKPRALSSEEAAAMGRAGGIASGKARQQRRMMRETLSDLLRTPIKDPEAAEALRAAGLPADLQGGMLLAQIKRALGGDVDSARFVRDTAGEKPTESLSVGVSDKPVRTLDLPTVSDADLARIADRVDDDAPALPEPEKER